MEESKNYDVRIALEEMRFALQQSLVARLC